jgi:hypothetical protein
MNMTDLSGQQLSCAVFDHLIMNQVNPKDAQLSGARFQSSTLNKADFTGADLRGAHLAGAHLNSPVWTGATCPDGTVNGTCADHLDAQPAANPATPTTTTVPTKATDTDTVALKAPAIFNKSTNGTYSCSGGTVSINGAGSTLHLTGQCDLVVVNGAGSHVEIDAASRIVVNAANGDVTYHGSAQVIVNGVNAKAHHA